MERLNIEQGFLIMKPLGSLMKEPNVNNAKSVSAAISEISPVVVQDLLEYILLPLTTHLINNSLSKDVKEELVRTLECVLLKVRIKNLQLFTRLYSYLLIQIYDNSQPTMVIIGHEELKSVVLSCITTLMHSCFSDVLEALYTKENAPKIGQAILLSITIARIEKSRTLRLNAVRTVMALCQVDDEADRTDIVLQDQVANVITLYLPGIASGLQEIALGNEIQGHKLTVAALKAWGKIISLVMQDKYKEDDIPTLNDLNTKSNNKSADINAILKSGVRSTEWFNAAALKLGILVQELNALRKHSHYKVRKELAANIHLLLKTCSRNMKPNVMLLIEYLISLSEDEIPEVREEATLALNDINLNYMENREMRPLVELVEENFYDLLTRLPRIIRRSDDNEQLACLNQLAGYLKLLGPQRLPRIMVSTPYIRRLLLALIYVIEIDCSGISVLQTINVKELEDPVYSHGSHLWWRFKFLQNKSCEEKVILICKSLGQFGDLRVLVDCILDMMSNAPQHRQELVLLLNWVINEPLRDDSALPIYKEIIEFYVTEEFWYPSIEVSEDVPLREAQNNILQCCLLTDGLGLIALNLGHSFDRFLLKTLYLVIERAGSGHSLINCVGIHALENIAKSQGYTSIPDLLRANVDYFSYHVTVKLRRVERNPGVLDVVGVVMKYSTMDVLPCLKEIVEDALQQLNNSFQRKNAYLFLKIFYIFVTCIKDMIGPKDQKQSEEKTLNVKTQSEEVIESLLEYLAAKEMNKRNKNESEESEAEFIPPDESEKEDDDIEEEEKRPVPLYIRMVESVMNRCLHFLPSKDIQQSLATMSILEEGLVVLSEWEDQLLPIVHLIWHPLVERFQDKNVLVINRAWQLLNTLARVSKDFIRSRTLKEVLPALTKFLSEAAKQSYNKSSVDAYRFTQMYKFQVKLLSTLGQLATDLQLQERELWDVLSIAEPYLSSQQNPALQKCCIQLYSDVADYHSDIAWVKCLSIWHSKISRIPTDTTFKMQNLKVTEDIARNEYIKNVKVVLKLIEDKEALVKR